MARVRLFPAILFVSFLLLAVATGETTGKTTVADAKRTCSSASRRFRGVCISSTNCGTICRTEGFRGGYCRVLRRSCVCTKPC